MVPSLAGFRSVGRVVRRNLGHRVYNKYRRCVSTVRSWIPVWASQASVSPPMTTNGPFLLPEGFPSATSLYLYQVNRVRRILESSSTNVLTRRHLSISRVRAHSQTRSLGVGPDEKSVASVTYSVSRRWTNTIYSFLTQSMADSGDRLDSSGRGALSHFSSIAWSTEYQVVQVELIWPAKRGFMKTVFLINKYSPIIDFTLVALGTSDLTRVCPSFGC